MHHLYYTLYGDHGRCPDCVVLMANPMDGSQGTVRHTVFRGTDDGWAFWQRIMKEASELVQPMGFRAHVAIFPRYGTDADPHARKGDNFQNYKRALHHTMQFDPSHKLRVKAACQLANLLQMDQRTLQ